MKLSALRQISFTDTQLGYDLVIVASGYESRARYLAEELERANAQISQKMVLGFLEHPEACARPDNDARFEEMGYVMHLCHGWSEVEVLAAVSSAVSAIDSSARKRILVDISSMSRVWYGAIVRLLMELTTPEELTVHFTYTPSQFVPPPSEYPPNRVVAPVVGFTGNMLPDKPTALVLGLGYDKDRAIGLKDHLDPQLTLLFYADPAGDSRYIPEVLQVNGDLINDVSAGRLFTYPINDCVTTFKLLDSVCNGLTNDWRVVLCSLGPKLFGLCCFLVASLSRDVSIWRVSADSHETPSDHKASDTPTVLNTTWTS